MSTPTPRHGRDAGEDHEDLAVDHHLSLPAFHSIREDSRGGISRTNSNASSSISNRSGGHHADLERAHHLDRLSSANSARSDNSARGKENEKDDAVRRHHSTRSSGGFLLEPVTSSNRRSLVPSTLSWKDSKANKGGERSELRVSKRRQRDDGHSRSSFRSSPLSSEVRPDHIIHNHAGSISPSSSRIDARRDESMGSGSSHMDMERSQVPKIGYDQDPAQIVNMALTLSEGRRRLASGRRYASSEQGERRVISATSTTSPRKPTKSRNIGTFLGSTRSSSRPGSPKQKLSTLFHGPGNTSQVSPADAAAAVPEHDSDADRDFTEQLSPATAARVEKAKAFFELAYEHRRLLPHLPPVRRPGSPPHSSGPEAFQKAYNPLQYVRNRKLRIWDKNPIDSEADGWQDLQRVKAWVDAVISSHPETQHSPIECVRLPPFNRRSTSSDVDEPGQSPSGPKTTTTSRIPDQFHARSIRPRSDWVTHPADMLADAYWLEQGMNKTKIQDRDNNPIYPPNTQFDFSGWRSMSPVDVPTILYQPSPPQPDVDLSSPDEPPPSALPELPTFTSALHTHKHPHHDRRRDRLKDSLHIKDTSSSRERSRLRRTLFRDSSESESSGSTSSGEGISERGRKRLRRKRHLSPGNEGLVTQGGKFHIKNSPHPFGGSRGDSSRGSSTANSKRSSVDHGTLNKLFNVDSLKRVSPLNRSGDRHDSPQPALSKIATRSSLEHETLPRASTEYDTTTAPNSPNGVEWPSIAINLSPPPSRSTSPKRKTRSAILHPFHRRHHKDHDQVSTTDFAHVASSQMTPLQGSDVEKQSESPRSRGTSPMSKGLGLESRRSTHSTPSPQPDRVATQSSVEHGLGNASKVSTRSTATTGSDHSKVRGIFKGGRIAEIVGNEVSRVGDFIWKRDPPSVYKHKGSASTSSVRSYDGAEWEKEAPQNGAIVKTPPTKLRSRSSTISSTKSERISPVPTKTSPPPSSRPLYNNPNLPSFTSPFQRDRDEQEKKLASLTVDNEGRASDSEDMVSRLATHHRSTSRSSRRDRTTLPKLDTRAPTPANLDRAKSYGFGAAFDLSRSRDASDLLNTAIGRINHAPVRPSRSAPDLANGDGSEAGQDDKEPAEVSWRDISRAYALLYTSTVKAREIGRRADEEGNELPKFLLDTFTPENQALHSAHPLRVKKRERHIVAARNIMKTLDRHSATFNDRLHWFSRTVAPDLHTKLQMLEDMVEKTMTPLVRGTADRAGELSMKLTTSSTLAVKELNDSIDAAFRRRRRGPIRLVRRVWFAGIEWTVVGLLWFIWAVVSLVQLVLGVTRGFVTTVKWLLWIA